MRIVTKRIKVIEMTAEEMQKFQELVTKAQQGQLAHYAETLLEDGSSLAVSVVPTPHNNPSYPHVRATHDYQ